MKNKDIEKTQEEREEFVVKLWKELKVSKAEFEFSCGGDSMNDTAVAIYNEKGETITNDVIEAYIDDEVYRNCEFYEASDGHYLGESGVVHIELNEDENSFYYTKEAQAEYCERVTTECLVELTDEEIAFVNEFVLNINGGSDETTNINYKKDFIITDKRQDLITSISDKVEDIAQSCCPEPEQGGEIQDWFNFNTNDDDISENGVTIKDKSLVLNVTNEFYVFVDSE